MATQGYSGSVDLISGIRPKNNGTFPLVDAHDVFVAAPDVRLDETLKDKRGITDLAVYDRLANWTSSSGTVARWDHGTSWVLPAVGGYLEYIGAQRLWVLYDPSLGYVTHGTTADEDALSLTFSVSVNGGEPEEITFTRPSVYASSGDRLATKSYADSIAADLRYALVDVRATDSPTITLADRAVNAVTVPIGMTSATLALPPSVPGRVRDLVVRMTLSTDVAVTFTGPSSAAAWDSSGDPSGTFAAGTHFLRLTEVAQNVFHVGGIASGDKLNSTSAAPAFDSTMTYDIGKHVTYNGQLYRCTTAVATAGAWNAANWTAEDMTTPDATLDIAAGRLRLVDTDGTVLWQQGYDLAAESSATLSCDKTNLFAFADTATTQAFSLPSAPNGKVGDFILDIDNSANTVAATATLTGIDTAFSIVVPSGQSLSQMLTFAAGERAELYFTQTAFKVNNLPTWKLVKQIVENGGAQA